MPDPNPQRQKLEHAQWRADFVRSLLEMHRAMPLRSPEWKIEETALIERLAAAEGELDRIKAERAA